jgi:hypothetical protein
MTAKDEENLGWWQSELASLVALVLSPIWFVATFLLSLPFVLYQAWVFVILWEWFVVPVFRLPPLQFGYAYGLLLIVWFLTPPGSQKRTEHPMTELLVAGIMGPTCSLAVGWIVKTFLVS